MAQIASTKEHLDKTVNKETSTIYNPCNKIGNCFTPNCGSHFKQRY